MSEADEERRLTTILAADVVGYSRLMAADEAGTFASLKAIRREPIEPKTAEYGGRTVRLIGDGALAEFPGFVEIVERAERIRHRTGERTPPVERGRAVMGVLEQGGM